MRVDASAPPGTGITAATMQFHGTADRYTLAGATAVATLYSNASTATANPAVTLRVGRIERRPRGGVHVRPRPLGRLHAAGQPGVGGTGAGRRPRHPPRRPVLRRAGGRRPARLDRREQDRHSAGRRAAAAAPQRGDAHGARQAAASAVLVPAAWREGRRRHERGRPLAGAGARRNGEPLRPLQAAEPGGMRRSRNWECIRVDVVHLPEQRPHERAGERLPGRRLRARAARRGRLVPGGAAHPGAAVGGVRRPARAVPGEVHERAGARDPPYPLRLLARVGDEPEGLARATTSGWTRTTTTSPARGSARGRGS